MTPVQSDGQERQLERLLARLLALPQETAWVEFKHNDAKPARVGEYLSALANSAELYE